METESQDPFFGNVSLSILALKPFEQLIIWSPLSLWGVRWFALFKICLFKCCFSVTQSCPTLCKCSTSGLSVPHHLPKFSQVHVHDISDAFQPSHSLTPSSPSALNPSQHLGLFQWVSCSHQLTKIQELPILEHQSFQWAFRVDFL